MKRLSFSVIFITMLSLAFAGVEAAKAVRSSKTGDSIQNTIPAEGPRDQFHMLQERLYAALKAQHALSPERRLVSAAYVCSLQFDGRSWPVINTVEQVRGAQVPRGVNQIVVLVDNLNVFKIIPYDDQSPAFCKGASLYVNGNDLSIDNTAPYGNVLTFYASGAIDVTSVDPNELPIPTTGEREQYLLR